MLPNKFLILPRWTKVGDHYSTVSKPLSHSSCAMTSRTSGSEGTFVWRSNGFLMHTVYIMVEVYIMYIPHTGPNLHLWHRWENLHSWLWPTEAVISYPGYNIISETTPVYTMTLWYFVPFLLCSIGFKLIYISKTWSLVEIFGEMYLLTIQCLLTADTPKTV